MPRSAKATTREARMADKVGGPMGADRFHRGRPALGLAYHDEEAGGRQDRLKELVHAGRRGRAGGTDDLAADGVDRADVIDRAVAEVDR